MREIKAIVRHDRLDDVVQELHAVTSLPGITVSIVRGIGRAHSPARIAGGFVDVEMAKLEIVVDEELEDVVVKAIVDGAQSGRPGDGKIFIYSVDRVVRIRTGEDTPSL